MKKAFLDDFNTKESILNADLDKEWDKAHIEHYKGNDSPLIAFREQYGANVFRVCKNLNASKYHRYKKCKSKIGSIIEGGQAWFGTLTFKDSVLDSTSAQTRRRYVSRLLKKVSKCYVANIDFGDKIKNPDSNEREHYHFVCYSDKEPDLSTWANNYGFVKIRHCGSDDKDIKKVCKYTTKLSRHALKASTEEGVIGGVPRLIYSRKTMYLPPTWLLDD